MISLRIRVMHPRVLTPGPTFFLSFPGLETEALTHNILEQTYILKKFLIKIKCVNSDYLI
jgi:hypothetical protein